MKPSDLSTMRTPWVTVWTALAAQAHAIAKQKGFWDIPSRNEAEVIALIHSELSEALEAMRKGWPVDPDCPHHGQVVVELADLVIRLLDFCYARQLPIADAIIDKMIYNLGRPHKHGKLF